MARPKGSKNKSKQAEVEVLNLQGNEVREEDLRASTINPILGNEIMTPNHTVIKDDEKPGSYIFTADPEVVEESEDTSTSTVGFSIQDDPTLEVSDKVLEVVHKVNVNNAFNRDSSVGKNPATIDGGEFYNFFD